MSVSDVSHHADAQRASDAAWRPPSIAARRRWLLQIGEHEVRLAEGEDEIRALVRDGLVGLDTPVYEVGLGPWTAGDIPDLARMVDEAAPRPAAPAASDVELTARTRFNSELAILDRPLAEHEIEYYDEVPRARGARWGRRLGMAVVAALVCFGGYRLTVARVPNAGARLAALRERIVHFVTEARGPSAAAVAAPTAAAAAVATPSLPAVAPPPPVAEPERVQPPQPAAASVAHARHHKHHAHRR